MEDSEIVRLFWEREETAVSEASRKFGTYCRSVAGGILRNREDAEECVNDALMRAWESIPPKKPTSLGAFLGRITKNLALDRIRMSLREKRGGGEIPLVFEELDEVISGSADVHGELERKEMTAAINRFLRKSEAVNRRAFVLRYWYCRSVGEVARELGISENSVSVKLSRMRKKLREFLKKEGYDI